MVTKDEIPTGLQHDIIMPLKCSLPDAVVRDLEQHERSGKSQLSIFLLPGTLWGVDSLTSWTLMCYKSVSCTADSDNICTLFASYRENLATDVNSDSAELLPELHALQPQQYRTCRWPSTCVGTNFHFPPRRQYFGYHSHTISTCPSVVGEWYGMARAELLPSTN